MFEMLMRPKKAERRPWELFFVGLFYASISVLLVNWIFAKDAVMSKSLGILVVLFTVMFSMPFVYYTIRLEEKKVIPKKSEISLLREHKKALLAFMWLFFGYVVAFSVIYILLPSTDSFTAQLETYCVINQPSNLDNCLELYGEKDSSQLSGHATSADRMFVIFSNNIYVLVFTLLFSLLFGAGVIFILAWNASVIAAAIGIFTKYEISSLPLGLLRYMIHGIPEIASYFVVALAGGMVSVAIIRHETGTEKFWEVMEDSLYLIIIAVVILFVAALLEVFVTPIFF